MNSFLTKGRAGTLNNPWLKRELQQLSSALFSAWLLDTSNKVYSS